MQGGFLMKSKFLIIFIIITLVLIFLVQNAQVVTLHLYFWKISMSQIILIPLILIIGFIAGYIVARFTIKKHV